MSEQLAITLLQTLAWPLVALIAFFGLRKDAIKLAKGASDLKKMLDDGSLIGIIDQIRETVEITRKSVDDLVIKEESKDVSADSTVVVNLTTDQMFEDIKKQWQSIVAEIHRRAVGVGVRTNLVGNVGVNATVDKLVENGAMPTAASALIKQVSNRWQPMLRNQRRMSEWLTPQVYTSFISLAQEAKAALALER